MAGTGCDYGTNWWYCVWGELDETYGYHFQWWNNHWFKPCSDNDDCDTFLNGETYQDSGLTPIIYSGFYESWAFYYDIYDYTGDLWWWSINDSYTFEKLSKDKAKARQWPCPENFHVPSIWEISKLFDMVDYDNYQQDVLWAWDKIHNQLLIPFAGRRSYDGEVEGLGDWWILWSSSPVSNYDWWSFYLYYYGSLNKWDSYYGYGNSIRCFYDKYEIYPQSFNVSFLNDGENIWDGEVVSWDKIPEEVINDYLTWLIKTWYNFSWWIISGSDELFDVENDVVITWMTLNAVWEIVEYEIDYKLDGWTNSENNTWKYTIETPDITLEKPTKDWYTFDWWFSDAEFTTLVTTIPTWTTWDIILYAKWAKIGIKPSWGSSGWGGRNSSKNNTDKASEQPTWNQVDSSKETPQNNSNTQNFPANASEWQNQQQFTDEFQQAYEFAKWHWITTMPSIQEADMNWKLTRIVMAKMLSYYAMNVLGQKPANIVTPKFNDVTDKLDSDYDNWVILAYQLGIMWINMPDDEFRPFDLVTRAEFATALSRMLYKLVDWDPYYVTHMAKLKEEWIIMNDDPNLQELRWYVMIMLMRSAK